VDEKRESEARDNGGGMESMGANKMVKEPNLNYPKVCHLFDND